MNKYKTLLSNTLLISIGTFTSKLLVFLMVRFYTGYLTPADYGTADLLTQTANLLFPIISLGITEGVFRFAMDSDADRKSVFTVGLLCIAAGSVLFGAVIPLLGLVGDFKGYVWLIVVYTIAACLHALCSQYIRAIGKTGLFAVQGIINTSLVIVLNILFLAVLNWGDKGLGVTGYVLSVVLADTLCTVFLVIKERLWRAITTKPSRLAFPKMLKYSLPLIPATIFWWITSVSDRYMVNAMISPEANGIYTVSYKLPTLLTLVSTVFMQAWQFSAVTESEGDKKEHALFFGQVWRSFQAVMFLAGAAVIAFAKPAMKLLTTSKFYSAWEYIPVLSLAMVFTALTSFMGTVYIVNRKSMISFITALIGALTNIVLNFLLIPSPLAAQGAAIATAASYMIVFVVRAINARKYIGFKLYSLHIILNTIILLIQAAVMLFNVPYWYILEAVCIALLLVINYKFLIGFIEKIFSFVFRRKK